jgi:hypothetical protein
LFCYFVVIQKLFVIVSSIYYFIHLVSGRILDEQHWGNTIWYFFLILLKWKSYKLNLTVYIVKVKIVTTYFFHSTIDCNSRYINKEIPLIRWFLSVFRRWVWLTKYLEEISETWKNWETFVLGTWRYFRVLCVCFHSLACMV